MSSNRRFPRIPLEHLLELRKTIRSDPALHQFFHRQLVLVGLDFSQIYNTLTLETEHFMNEFDSQAPTEEHLKSSQEPRMAVLVEDLIESKLESMLQCTKDKLGQNTIKDGTYRAIIQELKKGLKQSGTAKKECGRLDFIMEAVSDLVKRNL